MDKSSKIRSDRGGLVPPVIYRALRSFTRQRVFAASALTADSCTREFSEEVSDGYSHGVHSLVEANLPITEASSGQERDRVLCQEAGRVCKAQ